jgi:hypothetical protein
MKMAPKEEEMTKSATPRGVALPLKFNPIAMLVPLRTAQFPVTPVFTSALRREQPSFSIGKGTGLPNI